MPRSRRAARTRLEWTRAEARELVAAVHVGVETAGSPLATINDLGPCAIVADFGNNAGLIVGPELPRLAHARPSRNGSASRSSTA